MFFTLHVVTVLKSLKSYHKSTVCGCGCCCDAVVAITPYFCDAIVAMMPWLLWHHGCYDIMVAMTSWWLWHHGCYDAMVAMTSWWLWHHGCYDIMVATMPWLLWRHGCHAADWPKAAVGGWDTEGARAAGGQGSPQHPAVQHPGQGRITSIVVF